MADTPLETQYNNVLCKDQLGHWFKHWCAYWHGRGELGGRAARADLEATLILLQEDMTEIESIHASIRRELFVLSTQTHAMDFLELSDRHVLRCVRRHPDSYGVAPHHVVGVEVDEPPTESSDAEPNAKRSNTNVRTGAWRHFLSEFTSGDSRGCAQPGLNRVFKALPESELRRHEDGAERAKFATQAGGRGYRANKRQLAREVVQKSATEKLEIWRRSDELDPANSSAANALATLYLADTTDFDQGIRALKRGLRDATSADAVVNQMQTEVMEDHNSDRNRRNDPVLNSLPAEIVDSLGTNWHLLPHSFKGSLRHMRGSFPHATKVAGTLTSANPRKELSVSFTAKPFGISETNTYASRARSCSRSN